MRGSPEEDASADPDPDPEPDFDPARMIHRRAEELPEREQ